MIFKRINPPFLRYVCLTALGVLLIGLLFYLCVYFGAWGKLPDTKELSEFQHQQASEVYTADSVLIGKYYIYDRQPIPFENFPQHLVEALIAIEDQRFYSHSGVDYPSLFRVALKTLLMQDQSAGGGSTLTQQLAKNLYPRKNRKSSNIAILKIQEMIMASRLERIYSKEELLAHYLNTVSFGDNTFGIESTSLKFFNKRAKDLSIEEAATLVGMLKATYGYNPRIFPKKSLNRRNLVLRSMEENEYLTSSQRDSISKIPLKLEYREFDHNDGLAPYFREEVRKEVQRWITEQKGNKDYNLYTSGLKIYTTLDYRMQVMAEETVTRHFKKLQKQFEKSYGNNAPWYTNKKLIQKVVRRSPIYQRLKTSGLSDNAIMDSLEQERVMDLMDWEGVQKIQASSMDSIIHYMKFLNTGSLCIDSKSGAVKTWIGGINYKYFKYDHISQSQRQVGSTFKPIVYTAALEKGIGACTHFSAREVTYKNLEGWSPSNSGKKDEAYLNYSMEEALSKSVNTIAVKVLEETGIPEVLNQAKKMGITANLPHQPSLALGTGEVKLTELAGAYASFVNKGKAVRPYLIQTISNQKDSILAVFRPQVSKESAFSEETGQLMLQMMRTTVNSGTASRLRNNYRLHNDIAGKTGTTQNNKDAWFVALTPDLVHVTWVGLDDHEIGFKNTAMGQGANAALPLFALWMQQLNKDSRFNALTQAKFENPDKEILKKLDCPPIKRDGFLKRLFTNPKKKKKRRFRN